MINLPIEFEVCTCLSAHYKDTKGDAKSRNWGGFGRGLPKRE